MVSRNSRIITTILSIVLIAVVAFGVFYYFKLRRIDYTLLSLQIEQDVDKTLLNMSISTSDILKVWREEKEKGNVRWIQVTKKIKIPMSSTFEEFEEEIQLTLKQTKARILDSQVDEAQQTLTLKIGKGKILFQTLILKKEEFEKARYRAAIILDDAGYKVDDAVKFFILQEPLTISILPMEKYSKEVAIETVSRGFEAMLHLPMEPRGYPDVNPGKSAVLKNMSPDEIKDVVESALSSVPGVSGVNNHMGSAFTAQDMAMKDVLRVIKEHNLFFVDSKTTSDSVAGRVAGEVGIAFAQRDIFLDNEDDYLYIKEQIYKLIQHAVKYGQAIGIGHVTRRYTFDALKDSLQDFDKNDVELVFVSELVEH